MPRPRLAFFGSPDFAVPLLRVLSEKFEIAAVITQADQPKSKGLVLTPPPVAVLAKDRQLSLFQPTKLSQIREELPSIEVDGAVVAAYGKILPQWLLDWPANGMLNVHASLLPRHRGASPIQGAILAGDTTTGISYMQMNAQMDEGPVLKQSVVAIEPEETGESLFNKLSRLAEAEICDVAEQWLDGQLMTVEQDHAAATYTTLIHKADGMIDFDSLPTNFENMIRAYYSWPGVWGTWQGKRVKLLPGGFVQMEGKKAVPLADFRRGHPDFPVISF